jgi:hypothetical protein
VHISTPSHRGQPSLSLPVFIPTHTHAHIQ